MPGECKFCFKTVSKGINCPYCGTHGSVEAFKLDDPYARYRKHLREHFIGRPREDCNYCT